MAAQKDFHLDQPKGHKLTQVHRFSGWSRCPGTVVFRVDNQTLFGTISVERLDVAEAFNEPAASRSGFMGDVVLTSQQLQRGEVTVDICLQNSAGPLKVLESRQYTVSGPEQDRQPRSRDFDLGSLLVAHGSQLPLNVGTWTYRDAVVETVGPCYFGVPHFYEPNQAPLLRLEESRTTHSHSARARDLMASADGLVLDFGAGITPPEELQSNVLYLDAIQFPNTDVACTSTRLPFRDNTFAAIVSEAVFEHLSDPFTYAKELLRVLKPGGEILIDTAFLQPLHADPSHYFNMTEHGLRHIMAGFEILELGVQTHQRASLALLGQIRAALRYVPEDSRWATRLRGWQHAILTEATEYDAALGEPGQRALAAGFFVHAKKPEA